MSDFMKRLAAYAIPVGSGFAAGLALAALVTRTGLVELGDPEDATPETGDAEE